MAAACNHRVHRQVPASNPLSPAQHELGWRNMQAMQLVYQARAGAKAGLRLSSERHLERPEGIYNRNNQFPSRWRMAMEQHSLVKDERSRANLASEESKHLSAASFTA